MKKGKDIAALIIASILIFFLFFYGHELSKSESIDNIVFYMASITVFYLLFLFGRFICAKFPARVYECNTINRDRLIAVTVVGIMGGWFLCAYFSEIYDWPYFPAKYLRHNVPEIFYFLVLILFALFCINLAIRFNGIRGGRRIVGLLSVVVQGYLLYCPNYLADDLPHVDAYSNSIINAVRFAPYEEFNLSIYGHYGIIYILPVKLFAFLGFNEWEAVTLSISLVGMLVMALECWIFSEILDNDIVYIIALLANLVPSLQLYETQYYQVQPHRYLFQAVILAGCLWTLKHPGVGKIKKFIWFLCAVAMVWNVEIGVISAAVWCLCNIYISATQRGKYDLRDMFKNVLFILFAFILAWGMVNIYNIIVGGDLVSIYSFIYPLGLNDSYSVEALSTELLKPTSGYFLVILLFLTLIGYHFDEIKLNKLSQKTLMVVLTCVMGLGVFAYYINRTASTNAAIVCFEVVLLLALSYERIQESFLKKQNNGEPVIRYRVYLGVTMLILASMVLASTISTGKTLYLKSEGSQETYTIEEFVDAVDERLPDGTVAFGKGVSLLFSYMDRTTGIYITDWADMNQEAEDYLIQMLKEASPEYIFVNADQGTFIPNGYNEVDSFNYNQIIFKLFQQQ